MTLIESYELPDRAVALIELNGFPVVVTQTGQEVKWLSFLNLEHALHIYNHCIELMREIKN